MKTILVPVLLSSWLCPVAFAESSNEAANNAPSEYTVRGLGLRGPYAALADYCGEEEVDPALCARAAGSSDCGTLQKKARLPAPFTAARVLYLGRSKMECDIALQTEKGWWVTALAGTSPAEHFFSNGDRYHSAIVAIEPSPDGATLVIRGRFVHLTGPEKMMWLEHPRYARWYECQDRIVVCAVGASGEPTCTWPLPYSFTTYCHAAVNADNVTTPGKRLSVRVSIADYTFAASVRGHELVTTAAGARRTQVPIPGWNVVAGAYAESDFIPAEPTLPPRVHLVFP